MKGIDPALVTDVIEWDVLTWKNVLPIWEQYLGPESRGKSVLCLGERNGGLSLWFALKGFNVVCSDFGGVPSQAQQLHAKYNASVQYNDIDMFSIPYPDNHFDIVSCKSVIGGLKENWHDKKTRTLANQKKAVAEIYRILKPGGYFLGAENLKGSLLHHMTRTIWKGDKIGWRHPTLQELRFLFATFNAPEIRAYGFFGSHYPFELLNPVGAFLDMMFDPVVPSSWKYVSFLACKK